MAPPAAQSVTMDQWNDMKEMEPPKEVLAKRQQQQNSPARSKSATTISSHSDDNEMKVDDYGLSCTGLLGEEILMDTGFGDCVRASLQATAESLRKLSEAVVKPINKNDSVENDKSMVMVDHEALLQENERLKRENTWLQEENESLRGGTYDDEDSLGERTGKSV